MENKQILLSHGSGGKLTHNLIKEIFVEKFKNPILSELKDSGTFKIGSKYFALTTDSYVISPIFFPGGDIGKLSVCGTINDLSVVGARPLYISCALIIEEGFHISDLKKIILSIKQVAKETNVDIITGDTKVVEHGSCDKIFINTTGIGIIEKPLSNKIKPGDKILLSGHIGEHHIAILSKRQNLSLHTKIKSDCAPLNKLVEEIMLCGKVLWMRDPTRGGIGTSLCELALQYEIGIRIQEEKIPIKKEVKSVCEILGLDVLYLANEGKLLAVVEKSDAEKVLCAMRKNKLGNNAQIIGEVTDKPKGTVLLETSFGTTRIVNMLSGEQLPRIC